MVRRNFSHDKTKETKGECKFTREACGTDKFCEVTCHVMSKSCFKITSIGLHSGAHTTRRIPRPLEVDVSGHQRETY